MTTSTGPKRISAKHPIWGVLDRYEAKMIQAAGKQAETDAAFEIATLGNSRPEAVAANAAQIAEERAYYVTLKGQLARLPKVDAYHLKQSRDEADRLLKAQDMRNPVTEAVTECEADDIRLKHKGAADAAVNRIKETFEAIRLKISLDDQTEAVISILGNVGIKLPDISAVASLPLALDESLPVQGDTHNHVSVTNEAD